MTTFYDLLNINPDENINNIKLAYKNRINVYKYKELNEDDVLTIKLLKTAYFILSNNQLRELYNNYIFSSNDTNDDSASKDNNPKDHPKDDIVPGNSGLNNDDLDSLFNNILTNEEIQNINIPKTKSTSLEKTNNILSDRIFTVVNENTNKIIFNSLMPIQTREDRKLTN
jgi:DnaJ-class molecular chaperone